MSANYITDEIRMLIGARSEWVEACDPMEGSELRRFCQATMNDDAKHWRVEGAAQGRYGGLVAPLGMPVHAFRRGAEVLDDPLDAMSDPDFDGATRGTRSGLPKLPIPLLRVLNGGYEYEFYSHAKIGDRILRRSTYKDIFQREGKAGTLVFVVIEDEYATQEGRLLLKAASTTIMR